MSTDQTDLAQRIRDAELEHMRREIRERLERVNDKIEQGEPLSDEPPEQRKNS